MREDSTVYKEDAAGGEVETTDLKSHLSLGHWFESGRSDDSFYKLLSSFILIIITFNVLNFTSVGH